MFEMFFRYDGRVGRSAFVGWGSLLVVANLVVFLLVFAALAPFRDAEPRPDGLVLVAAAILLAQLYVFSCGSIVLAAKRLRDAGRRPGYAFWQLAIAASAFVIGWPAALVWAGGFIWLATEPSARSGAWGTRRT